MLEFIEVGLAMIPSDIPGSINQDIVQFGRSLVLDTKDVGSNPAILTNYKKE